jgi:hypothetical protein
LYGTTLRYADKAKTMTAVLPVTIATSFGEVVDVGVGVDGDGDGAVPANGLGAMEDVLLGAKNLTVLAKYVADGRRSARRKSRRRRSRRRWRRAIASSRRRRRTS